MGTVASANDEWIELANATDQPIDLVGWQIKNGAESLVIGLEGTIEPGGRMPVNTSGGQLSEVYFMGLTPLTEGVMQIMGRCGDRQLGPTTNTREPKIILCSDNGGILQSHMTVILRRL